MKDTFALLAFSCLMLWWQEKRVADAAIDAVLAQQRALTELLDTICQLRQRLDAEERDHA